jgi:hypothetical protein
MSHREGARQPVSGGIVQVRDRVSEVALVLGERMGGLEEKDELRRQIRDAFAGAESNLGQGTRNPPVAAVYPALLVAFREDELEHPGSRRRRTAPEVVFA